MSTLPADANSVLNLLRQLPARERLKVIAQALPEVERDLPEQRQPLQSLWGLCADLGIAPGEEEIRQIRREIWANFPREDI